jgi:dihydrofolate reductase
MSGVLQRGKLVSRPVSLFILTSLDGKIARPDGSIDWIHTEKAEGPNGDCHYEKFFSSLSAVITGRKTFDISAGFEELPFAGKQKYVFTRQTPLPPSPNKETEYISEDPVKFVRNLKQESLYGEKSRIWLLGGGDLVQQLHDARLVDELILTIQPIIIGPGIPLFNGNLRLQSDWSLQSCESWSNGLVQLTYTLKDPPQ